MSDLQPLPLGTSTFSALRAAGEIYVDKTQQVYALSKRRSKVFLSRPRRFGKSLLVSTFESFFKYGLRDFSGLAIEKLASQATYRVVRLDFSVLKDFSSAQDFKQQLEWRLQAAFRAIGYTGAANLIELSSWLALQPDNSIVLLIDEYDAPLTSTLDRPELMGDIQRLLSQFYSSIKSLEGCLRFLFVTGVTKFAHTGIFSGFNNLDDISLSSEYATLLGYTEDEVKSYFAEHLKRAAQALACTQADVLAQLRCHYNGFCFDEKAQKRVYCPWSVLNFLNSPARGFVNYWYQSAGQPNVLKKYLAHHHLEHPSAFSQHRSVWLSELNASLGYQDLQLTALLFQAGYLTIEAVQDEQKVQLGFPNQEVSSSMAQLYCDELLGGKVYLRPADSPSLVQLLARADLEQVVQRFNAVFAAIDYQKYPVTDEAACRGYLQVLMMGADMVPNVELHTAQGRSDLEVSAGNWRWVFEIKFARTQAEVPKLLDQGLEQIRQRHYGESFAGNTPLKLLRVALVFSESTRRFERWALA